MLKFCRIKQRNGRFFYFNQTCKIYLIKYNPQKFLCDNIKIYLFIQPIPLYLQKQLIICLKYPHNDVSVAFAIR